MKGLEPIGRTLTLTPSELGATAGSGQRRGMICLMCPKIAAYRFSGASPAPVAPLPPHRISSPGTPGTPLFTHLTMFTGCPPGRVPGGQGRGMMCPGTVEETRLPPQLPGRPPVSQALAPLCCVIWSKQINLSESVFLSGKSRFWTLLCKVPSSQATNPAQQRGGRG